MVNALRTNYVLIIFIWLECGNCRQPGSNKFEFNSKRMTSQTILFSLFQLTNPESARIDACAAPSNVISGMC